MSTRRLSTVHDLATLRLHPDGTRVQNSDKNLRIRASKYAARDSKGNWFARDAGGTGEVKQRFSKSRAEDAEEEQSTEAEEEELTVAKPSGKQRAETESEGEREFKDYRARKRRRYIADESFIAPTTSGTPSIHGSPKASSSRLSEEDPHELPTPNAETLKCMHYFACNYYTAMGQLRDSTKRSRRSKKARRKRKLQEGEDGGEAAEPPNKASDNDSSTEEESCSSSDSEDEGEEGDGTSVGYGPQTRRRRERRTSPDMYKAFDGSALMAISMLVQEHVASLLDEDVPEEWDAEMQAEEEAQRSRQAALSSLRPSRPSRSSLKAQLEHADGDRDEEAEEQPEKETEMSGRRTRGVVLPKVTIPFADDSSEDDDYVP